MSVLIIQKRDQFYFSRWEVRINKENIHSSKPRHYPSSGRKAASAELRMWALFSLPFSTVFQTVITFQLLLWSLSPGDRFISPKFRKYPYPPIFFWLTGYIKTWKGIVQICPFMDLLWAFLAEGPTSKWAVDEDFFPSYGLRHTRVSFPVHC